MWTAGPDPARRSPRSAAKIAAAAVGAAVVVAAGVGIGHGLWPKGSSSNPSLSVGGTPSATGKANSGTSGSGSGGLSGSAPASAGPTAVASTVSLGLVDINTTIDYGEAQAAGTGMVLTSSGEVLTNNHVIEGATSISVTDIGNGNTYSATVVGYDRNDDVAVLQLQNASGLRTISIGNSANASVGESVVGIGNAGGVGGTPSAAAGSIVALGQSITASDSLDGSSEQLTGLIETNADIQPGDSGGPLVDSAGQVLGIDTAGSSGSGFAFQQSSGDGFAIPIDEAVTIAKEIVGDQTSATVHVGATAFLGVEVESTGSGGSGSFGDTGGNVSGTEVAGVLSGGAAAQAGLSSGDVITALGGQTIKSPNDLANALTTYHPGQTVQLDWLDQAGQQHSESVQLSSGPPA
jgi:S1-C subfamily serine protease